VNITSEVKEYYGETLSGSDDLQTNACCTDSALPLHIKNALANVHDEVLSHYYGCGLIAPDALENCKILDLGSGSGRDAYVLAQHVGEGGKVVGVDMTPAQLEIARNQLEWHRKRFNHTTSNVEFIEAELENLGLLNLKKGSFDVIVSNCVINLCKDKRAVLSAAKDLLKSGGEIYFSDVYSDRRIPTDLLDDPVLYGECLSGALYINDFESLVKELGFADSRIVESRRLTIDNEKIEEIVGDIKFYSLTYRLFNLEGLEPNCEDYGQSVKYKGTIPHCENSFTLDDHHTIIKDEVFPVCGNTWKMLKETRFEKHFEFSGDFSEHLGVFSCGGEESSQLDDNFGSSCCTSSTSSSSDSCCSSDGESSDAERSDSAPAPAIVKTEELKELWFHTGTNCNLSCVGCLEGSHPGDNRVEMLTFDEAKGYIDEAVKLGVQQFSFTGGEPFINSEIFKILAYALELAPCLVLTNGTAPLQSQIDKIIPLKQSKFNLQFRVSLDSYLEDKHDAIRGKGKFAKAIEGIHLLENAEFTCSVARHLEENESGNEVDIKFRELFKSNGLKNDMKIISFPELLPPDASPEGIPVITMNCLKPFNGKTRFMCESSRMIVKKSGTSGVYACTLVDDHDSYNLGETLTESLRAEVPLHHHRCFSCYKSGASCSEL
jgi:arsenite methyltransferase